MSQSRSRTREERPKDEDGSRVVCNYTKLSIYRSIIKSICLCKHSVYYFCRLGLIYESAYLPSEFCTSQPRLYALIRSAIQDTTAC